MKVVVVCHKSDLHLESGRVSLLIMSWFLDFEGFQFAGIGFIVKEIAILDSTGDRCYNYFVTGPRSITIIDKQTYNYQYDMHNLRWEWGDYEFNEAMEDIARKIKCDTVNVKGHEKCEFISRLFPSASVIELEHVPPFKNLNNCMHERCEVRHGNHCARRKVYELKHVFDVTGL
jgi:hypothetical protein